MSGGSEGREGKGDSEGKGRGGEGSRENRRGIREERCRGIAPCKGKHLGEHHKRQ